MTRVLQWIGDLPGRAVRAVLDVPGRRWVSIATVNMFALLWSESLGWIDKAPAWYVAFPTGGFYFILGLYVVGPAGPGVTGAVRYYIDSVFNSQPGTPPAERKEGA